MSIEDDGTTWRLSIESEEDWGVEIEDNEDGTISLGVFDQDGDTWLAHLTPDEAVKVAKQLVKIIRSANQHARRVERVQEEAQKHLRSPWDD